MEDVKYRFFVTTQAGEREIIPVNTNNLNISWIKDQNSAFFRKQLTGKLKITGDDFDYLLAQEQSVYRCTQMPLIIEKNCDGFAEFFNGRLLCDDGTWSLSTCEVEIQANSADAYACYDDNKDTEVNLFDIAGHDEHVNTLQGTLETVTYTDVEYPPDDWQGDGTPEEGGWVILHKLFTQDPTTGPPTLNQTVTWARETIETDFEMGDPWIEISATPDPDNPLLIHRVYARPPALFDKKVVTTKVGENTYQTETSFKYGAKFQNGFKLFDVLSAFLFSLCPDLTLKSDFFQWNADNISDINYETGELSKVKNLILFQKSDVKRPPSESDILAGFAADDAATIANTSFDDLLQDILTTFKLQYWIDDDNNFRIEHPSYFNKVLGLDLTDQTRTDLKFRIGTKVYSYVTDGLPKREKFTWMDEVSFGDFAGQDIVYQSTCSGISDKNNKNIDVKNITTDVELCLDNPDEDSDVSDEGFVLMACDADNNLLYQTPILGGHTLNNTLSWAALQYDYFRYNNYFKDFILNNNAEVTQKLLPNKKQTGVIAVLCCGEDFDPDKLVKTVVGTGEVNTASLNLYLDQLTLEILFEQNKDLTFNNPPVALDGNDMVAKNGAITIDVLARASDSDGTIVPETLTIVIPPLHGTPEITVDNKILYTPNEDYVGPDSFTWTVEDDFEQPSNQATENITVFQPAVAVDDVFKLAKNKTLNRNIYNLLTNDFGVLPLSAVPETKLTTHGSVQIFATGEFHYTPNLNYVGDDTFDYTLKDVNNETDTATVTIHVFEPVTVYAKLIKGVDQVEDVIDICFRPPPAVSGPTHVGAQTTNSFDVNYYSDAAGTVPLDTTGYESIIKVNIHKVDNGIASDELNDSNYMMAEILSLPDYVTSYFDNGCDGTLNHHYTQVLSLVASPDYTII